MHAGKRKHKSDDLPGDKPIVCALAELPSAHALAPFDPLANYERHIGGLFAAYALSRPGVCDRTEPGRMRVSFLSEGPP